MILPRLLEGLIGTIPAIALTFLLMLGLGVMFVPLLIWLKVPAMSRSLAEIVGRLMVTLQMVAYGWSMALVHRTGGVYETAPMDRETMQIYLDGEWTSLNESKTELQRFAGGWFTELDERGDGDVYVQPDEVETMTMNNQKTDIVDSEDLPGIGTVYGYNPYHGEDDGVLIDLVTLGSRMKDTNRGQAAEKGVNRGLEEGADLFGPSAIFYGVMVIGMVLLGVISGGGLIIIGEWLG